MTDWFQLAADFIEAKSAFLPLQIDESGNVKTNNADDLLKTSLGRIFYFSNLLNLRKDISWLETHFSDLLEKYTLFYNILWSVPGSDESQSIFTTLESYSFSLNELYELIFLLNLTESVSREELIALVRLIYLSAEWKTFEDSFIESLFCVQKIKGATSDTILEHFAQELKSYGISIVQLDSQKILDFLVKFFGENSQFNDLFNILKLLSQLTLKSEYFNELIQELTLDEVMLNFSPWATHAELHKITQSLMKHLATKLKTQLPSQKIPIDDLNDVIKPILKRNNAQQTPLSYFPFLKLIEDHIEPRALRMEDLMELSPEKAQRYIPKKAFSVKKEKIELSFLGGSRIGHSGIVLKINDRTILLDFGLSVTNQGIPEWDIALEAIDCVLVSHAHLDHIGALPLLYDLGLDESWFAASPTNEITKILLNNNATLFEKRDFAGKIPAHMRAIASRKNIGITMNYYRPLIYKKTVEISPDIYVTAYPASHIFGSSGYLIEVDNKKIFYTGDFNLDSTALFAGATFPTDVDCLIFDGTYFDAPAFDPKETDNLLRKAVQSYKRTIIPSFTVGRAQEVLMRLNQLNLLENHQVTLIGMASRIAQLTDSQIPYNSEHIDGDSFKPGSIVIAGSGMLTGGTSRSLLDSSHNDPQTSVILCGYQAPGTLGQSLRDGNPLAKGLYKQPVFNARMSAHSSSNSLRKWLSNLHVKHKILVHYPGDPKIAEDVGIVVPNIRGFKFYL